MVASMISLKETPLTFKADAQGPAPRGDMRSFNASLGTIPDYGGPGAGKKGVLLSGVRAGSGAEKGGKKKGDILVRLGKAEIASVEDLMFVLNASKPGETVPAVVVRDGKEVKLEVTFGESGGKPSGSSPGASPHGASPHGASPHGSASPASSAAPSGSHH